MTIEKSHVAETAEFESADRSLRKSMGFNQLLFLSVTALIGSGWLFAAINSSAVAGPAAIVSWAVGGVFVIFIAFSYMEPSGMLPRSGAIVRYPALTHGAFLGWFMGWAYWLSAVTVPAIEAEAVVTYLGGRFPSTNLLTVQQGVPEMSNSRGLPFGILLMIVFFLLNFFGVRLLAEVNKWLTWWKIIVPVVTACFLFTIVKSDNYSGLIFHSAKGFAPYGVPAIFGAISSTGILFSYLGFRQALDFGGEAKNPQKHVPLATILSVLIAFVIYVAIQIGFTGSVDWSGAHAVLANGSLSHSSVSPGDWLGLKTSNWGSAPLYTALAVAGISIMPTVLIVDAALSPSATGWVYLGTSGRTNYGLSVNGTLPKILQRPNRWQVPWVSMVVALVVGCIFFIPAPSWYLLVGFISSATALTYIMGGVGTIVMRKHAPTLRRPFRLPWMWVMAPIGFAAAWMLVYWSGFAVLIQVYGAAFLGLPVLVWYHAHQRGWFANAANNIAAQVMSLVFLGTWIYINWEGGWLLRITPGANPAWPFTTYFFAMMADVAFFCLALWLLSTPMVRHQVGRGMWIIVSLFALLPVSYYGYFGPLKTPVIGFPWDTLIALAVGLNGFVLALISGYRTDELNDIITASEAGSSGEAPVTASVS